MIGREEKSQGGDVSQTDFEALFESEIKELQEGDIIKGRVVEITPDSVMVDVGYKSEGQVPLKEFLGADGKPTVKVGDEITVLLEKREDDNGYIVLSKAKAEQVQIWDDIIKCAESNLPMEGIISQRIKGGFYVDIQGVIAFLPGSQVDLKPVRNPDKLIGQSFEFRILKYNRRKNNVIVSRRSLLEDEREAQKKITLEHIAEGAVMDGLIKNITDYGAFIDLGGIDGLVHLTDLSWGKITHPSQILKVGDRINVKILKYNKEDGKISLGLKQTTEDPWLSVKETYPVGTKTTGTVVNLTDYGAFVEIAPGLEGLVHISEMSWTKLKHPSQKVKVGDVVDVLILDIDSSSKRISLGMKQAEANPWDELGKRYPKGTKVSGQIKNITDFGVFIGVEDGIDGLVHVSDLSWKKIKHPSEIFKKGQEVEAVVLNVDSQNRRFSLSIKLLERNPWEGVHERYKPGMIVDGKVTSVAEFGAFIELEAGLEGLVHVSELGRGKKRGADIKVGDIVEVEILNVDPEDNKIGLSIRTVKSSPDDEHTEGALS
ncbi:MAG: 30S ribosomal protein S1 [Deltaproteobacteria bacterium]